MKNKSIKQTLLLNPVVRIILGLLVCFAAFIIMQNVAAKLLGLTGLDKNFSNLIKGIVASVAVIIAYKLFYRKIENREVSAISSK